jgi:prepilin-type N-terminal cleavage/methylation domain-containing protein
MRLGREEGGYSIIELLTAMAILSVVLGGISTLFVQGSNAEAEMNLRFQAQTQARLAIDKMRRELHSACSVSAGWTASSATFNMVNNAANPPACDGTIRVTWCAQGSANRWGLYKISGATCTGGTKFADYLVNATTPNTAPAIFSDYRPPTATANPPSNPNGHNLGSIAVALPVNVKPARPLDMYQLQGAIVLRNSGRL